MKKQYYRLMAVVIAVILSILGGVPASAVEPRATLYIEATDVGILRTENKEIKILYSVDAATILDKIGVYYITVQRSTDQQTWTPEQVLYYFDHPEFMSENYFSHSGSLLYTGTRGYYYRAKIVFLAEDDGHTETDTVYTQTVYIPLSGNGGRIAD